ncbi:MAG: LysE family translocator [Pikeienuella sp.]|uniref:LysE family translocator n=1 Tax=Pikeienuella sp. TaxID=2831957 RepID=UPI003918BB29
METDLLLGLAAFAFASSVTPGPNNMMLMASGANFGFRRTLPHMLGVALGFVAMAVLVGLGLMQVFARWPILHDILMVVSVAYLLWLAWRIANAAPKTAEAGARPMTFLEAAAFQWVNPKAWTMALTAVTVYAPDRSLAALAAVALIFGAINLPSVGSWAALGVLTRRALTTPARLRLFNRAMALLLVASLWPVLAPSAW